MHLSAKITLGFVAALLITIMIFYITYSLYVNETACLSTDVHPILNNYTEKELLYNPSIAMYNGKPLYSIRVSAPQYGSLRGYINGGFRLKFHSKHLIVQDNQVLFELPTHETFTDEDGRLVIFQGQIWLFTCRNYFGAKPLQMAYTQLDPFLKQVIRSGTLDIPKYQSSSQKNWVLYSDKTRIWLIPYLNPLEIYAFNPGNLEITLISTGPKHTLPFRHLRGSSQLVRIGNKLLGIAHVKNRWRGFTNVAYIIDFNSKQLVSYSNEFVFNQEHFQFNWPVMIEFCSGMALLNDDYLRIVFGVWNKRAVYLDMSVENFIDQASQNTIDISPGKTST